MRIKFNCIEDFIHELDKDKDKIERGIVRVNNIISASGFSPAVWNMFVAAECIIGGHVVEYRESCGNLWGHGTETDEKTREKNKELRERLDAALFGLGITDIRGGTIEEAQP